MENKMNTYNSDERVTLEVINQLAYVYLNRPNKQNALDMPMFFAIDKTIKRLKKNKKIRAVIVTTKADNFCTGLDVKSVMKSPVNALKLLFKFLPWQSNLAQRVSTGWRSINVPVFMVIEGRCWGGGLQIALGGDFRIASPNASLSIMESRWGLIPDMGGTIPLRELVNQDTAKELAMTAKIINGNEAKELGLVTHVHDNPLSKAEEITNIICKQSPDSIAATKRLYNKSWWSSSGMALARESYYQLRILIGKNSKIKTYNQTHDKNEHKEFCARKNF